MPDFYSGPSPVAALSGGLMAGYQFVDNIRRRKADDLSRERNERMQERQDERAAAGEARAATSFELAQEDRLRGIDRENSIDLARATASSVLTYGGLDKLPDGRRAALINTARAADKDMAGASDEDVWSAIEENMNTHDFRGAEVQAQLRQLGEREDAITEILSGIGQRSAGSTGPAPAPRSPASPSPVAPGASRPSALAAAGVAPIQARAPSDVVTTVPGNSATRGRPIPAPAPIARPIDMGRTPSGKGTTSSPAEIQAQVAAAPLDYAASWAEKRDVVKDPTQRGMTDARVLSALQEDIGAAKAAYEGATDPREKATQGRRLVVRQTQLDKLSKVRASNAVDMSVPRGVAPGDKAANVLTAAVDAQRQSGPQTATQDEVRSLTTAVNRASSGTGDRVSPTQLKRIARAASLGIITLEQGQNLMRHGRLDQPPKPTIQPLGNGYAALVGENGISLIELPGGDGKDGGGSAESNAQQRLLTNDRLEYAFNSMKSKYGKDEAQQHMTAFLQVLKREGSQLTGKSGIPLINPKTGALNPGAADPGEWAELMATYEAYNEGEVEPWIFKGGKSFSDYAPQGASSTGGWSVTPVE